MRLNITHPCEGLEAQVMTFDRLNLMCPSEPSIAIHDKGHMLRNWPLSKGTDEQLPQLLDGPFDRWGGEQPPSNP